MTAMAVSIGTHISLAVNKSNVGKYFNELNAIVAESTENESSTTVQSI